MDSESRGLGEKNESPELLDDSTSGIDHQEHPVGEEIHDRALDQINGPEDPENCNNFR